MPGPLDLVRLNALMKRSRGRPEVSIGLIDGPVAVGHPDLVGQAIHEVTHKARAVCSQAFSTACTHGTFVAGMLCAKRGSAAPAICSSCTLLLRPIFAEGLSGNYRMPSATPEELAEAIMDTVNAGARVINLSAALTRLSSVGELQLLGEALDHASRRGVLVVAAAGNQGTVGSSAITRHPWVIAVVACDLQGRPTAESNLGNSIARRGLSAPGENITSLGTNGQPVRSGGTSVAAPFVTGTIALLLSEFPASSAADIRFAVTQTARPRQTTVVPPLLDAWAAFHAMVAHAERK